MFTKNIIALFFVFICFVVASPSDSYARSGAAEVVYLEGSAVKVSKRENSAYRLKLGSMLYEGDRIKTASRSSIELLFDNGTTIKLDENTDLTVSEIATPESGRLKSIFYLATGVVKSAVRKIFAAGFGFEYHTKAAIAGVSGTPPFVVSYDPSRKIMDVDLLGAKGQKGSVYVESITLKEKVTLTPGYRTTARYGRGPERPSPISINRFRALSSSNSFKHNRALNMAAKGEVTVDDALKGGSNIIIDKENINLDEQTEKEQKEQGKSEAKENKPATEAKQGESAGSGYGSMDREMKGIRSRGGNTLGSGPIKTNRTDKKYINTESSRNAKVKVKINEPSKPASK